jgi:DNA-binding response OmpR family regulator
MKPIHILVAEDDDNIRTGLVDTLESEGYRASPATDGKEAIDLFESEEFDLLLLDIMMPEKSGYDVCRVVRATNEDIPVIMLTAKGEEIDKVIGLQLGADDYITKPFGVHELLARISAVLRRSQRRAKEPKQEESGPERFTFGLAEIDTRQYKVRRGENTFDISARELQLLKFFHSYPNEVLSRDRILNAVWGIEYGGTTRTLDQHVAQLRKKIEPDPARPRFLTTVYGGGYRFEVS